MKRVWDATKRAYLRAIEPVADLLVRLRINPNAITTVGTLCSITGGVLYGAGHIRIAGWWLGLTALFDVLDGTVARRTGRSSTFGAFYDSTLDRIADGAVLGGLAIFYLREAIHAASTVATGPGLFDAISPVEKNVGMAIVCLAGIIGTFLVSYTRARAEALGIDAKVGVMQRPERVSLLSAPQAFFGLALDGWVLIAIVVTLTVTAWITACQRIAFVYARTRDLDEADAAAESAPRRVAATSQSSAGPGAGSSSASSSSPAAPRV